MNDNRDAPTPQNRISEPLHSLSVRLTEQVERAAQVHGPSPLLAEIGQTVDALRELVAYPADAQEAEAAPAGPDFSALQHVVEAEELASRIARQIESSLGQLVTNAVTELEYGIPLLQSDPATLESGLQRLKRELQGGREHLRWIVADLRPPHLLADMGLGPSLVRYADHFSEYSGLLIETNTLRDFGRRLPASMELGLFRIMQEALKNAHQHAKATRVILRVEDAPPTLTFAVEDDGEGFDNTLPARGLGLIGMRQRARAIGGDLRILTGKGMGTSVAISVSVPETVSVSAR